MKLTLADVGRRTAPKVCKPQLPSLNRGRPAVAFHLFDKGIEIDFDLARILVGIDFEVAKLTTLPAEGNVEIEAERIAGSCRSVKDFSDFRQIVRLPLRERRVIGNEIIADFGARGLGISAHKTAMRIMALRN